MLFFGMNDTPSACAQIGLGPGACIMIGMNDLKPQKPNPASA